MKNVYLVQVVDNYGPNKFLPLAISYHWLSAIEQFPNLLDQYILKDVLIEKVNIETFCNEIESPSIVIMSCYIWNWKYNCELAKKIKKLWPDCFIIVGGPQIDKKDFLLLKKHNYFDIAVLGENEDALGLILSNIDTQNFNNIPGVITNGRIIPGIERTKNLNKLPSPILSGFYDTIIDNYERKHNQKFLWQVTYETLRGCPYHCSFCDIGEDYWNKIHTFDIDRIFKEIEWISSRKIEYVSVCDSNWGMLERDYEITKFVVEQKLKTGYPKFWDVDWAKNNQDRIMKIAELDKKSGTELFKGITFALQSLDSKTLKSVDRFNLSENVIVESMKFYKEKDIPTYSELIWPLPGETLNSLQQGIQKLIDMGQEDFLMVHPTAITPNSPMGQADYLKTHEMTTVEVPLDTFWLEVEDIENYITETMHTPIATKNLSFDDIIKGHLFSHWIVVFYYYGWAHYVMKYLKVTNGINETLFVKNFIEFITTNKQGICYQEHVKTQDSIIKVYQKGQFWGRLIDKIYWEYKSATSLMIHRNRETFYQELKQFLKEQYNLDNQDIIEFNSIMCVNCNVAYPIKYNTSTDILKILFNIEDTSVGITHRDLPLENEKEFVKIAYHRQRKTRYWRCQLFPLSKDSQP